MKRAAKNALGLLLAAVFLCGNALAVGETYSFEEFDFEVTVPEGDYDILTRDMDPDSPTLADVGLTAEQVNELMEPDMYLIAFASDSSYALYVSVIETDVSNYDVLNQREKDAVAASVEKKFKERGFVLADSLFWYEEGEMPYIVVELVPSEESDWSYQYQTVYNGRRIVISAGLVDLGDPTDEIREQTRLMTESIHFTRRLPTPQDVLDAYEEKDSWSLPKTLIIVACITVVVVFGSIFATKARKAQTKHQTFAEEGNKKRSVDDSSEESTESTGGNDL